MVAPLPGQSPVTHESRAILTAVAAMVYLVFVAAALRSARHTDRVARQWGNDEASGWRNGKLKLVISIIGLFVVTQQVFPVPALVRSVVGLGLLLLLVWGEYDMGTAFKNVADAQDRYHDDASDLALQVSEDASNLAVHVADREAEHATRIAELVAQRDDLERQLRELGP